MTERLLTRQEVAELLNLPARTLDNWAYRHEGPPFFRLGRHARYRRDDVEAWLEGRRTGASK